MSLNAVKLRIEGDSSKAISSLNQVKNHAHSVADDIQGYMGSKLKDIFGPAILEETLRRTGEWAAQVQRAAGELNIATDVYQGMEIAAKRANLESAKLFTFFERIQAESNNAINGNTKLAQSFSNLFSSAGVTDPAKQMELLRKGSPQELMNTVLKGANKYDSSFDLQNIFGARNLNDIQSFSRQMNGRGFEQYAKDNEHLIVPNNAVKEMGQAWIHFVEDMKALGVRLAPLAQVMLAILDGIMNMVTGIVSELSDVAKGIGLYIGGFKIFGGGGQKNNTAFQEWGKARELRNKAFVEGLKEVNPFYSGKEIAGLSKEANREARGGGAGIATLATFGLGPVLKTVGVGARSVSSAAGLLGGEKMAAGAAGLAGRLGEASGGGLLGFLQEANDARLQNAITEAERMTGIKAGSNPKDVQALFDLAGKKNPTNWGKFISAMGYAGYGLTGYNNGQNDINSSLSNTALSNPTYNRMPRSFNFNDIGGSGGNSNLRIGGVYGTDVSLKIITLNQKMVDLLQQISMNTAINKSAQYMSQDADIY